MKKQGIDLDLHDLRTDGLEQLIDALSEIEVTSRTGRTRSGSTASEPCSKAGVSVADARAAWENCKPCSLDFSQMDAQ